MRSRTMTPSPTSTEGAPERAGRVLRSVGRGIPGTVGPLMVAVGLWLAWPPLGVIALGLTFWALDRRVP